MTDRSIGIIYALKNGESESLKDRVIKYMCSYSGCEPYVYTDERILNLLEQTFADLCGSAKCPMSIVKEYFDLRHRPWNQGRSEIDLLAISLSLTQVKELNYDTMRYEYINGFRDIRKDK